jgi:uncharacterized Zn finger protein
MTTILYGDATSVLIILSKDAFEAEVRRDFPESNQSVSIRIIFDETDWVLVFVGVAEGAGDAVVAIVNADTTVKSYG